jgi:octaprenyl-diphosphate synthase
MLNRVEIMMREFVCELDESALQLYDKLSHGKRLRAKLILKIADDCDEAIKLASIVELIHAASLLHDDVIDDATTRRGKSSINALFGNKSAIMLGDILYSKGFFELTSFDEKISKSISDAVAKLSVGELMDVQMSEEFNPSLEKYFDMIYKKTAVLIESTAQSAALLVDKDEKKFALYGKNLGLAFQIIDDVLDITMSSEKLGKPALSDFKEGKATLPYIYLYQSLDEKEKNTLLNMYKKELNENDQAWIKLKMQEYYVIEKSVNYAKELGEEALLAIESENSPELEKIITDMIERDF